MTAPVPRALSLVVVVVALACATGCAHTVPAPSAPAREMPTLEAEPEEPSKDSGLARVYFTADEPARVERVLTTLPSRGRTYDASGLLCESTPCVVTLPYGDHRVTFTSNNDPSRTGRTVVRVQRATEVVNHNLGRVTTNAGATAGGAFVTLGILSAGVGLGILAADVRLSDETRRAALGMTGAGFGMIGLGGIFFAVSPVVHQESATTRWSPAEPSSRGPGPALVGATGSLAVPF